MDMNYVKTTDGGRLYIETKDFFKDKKVQKMISRLKE